MIYYNVIIQYILCILNVGIFSYIATVSTILLSVNFPKFPAGVIFNDTSDDDVTDTIPPRMERQGKGK